MSELSDDQRRLGVVPLGAGQTAPRYRLFTVGDRIAALVEDTSDGAAVRGELGEISDEAWNSLLATDPPEMYSASVVLVDGSMAAAVFADREYLSREGRDITDYGDFATYRRSKSTSDR